MKWFVLVVLGLLAFLPLGVAAQEQSNATALEANETEEVVGDPGVTPDSPLWGIDVAIDRLRLALARGPDKAKLGLEVANERLLEMQAMGKRGDADAASKAEQEHGRIISDVGDEIAKLKGDAKTEVELKGIERGMANHLAALARVRAFIEANPNIPEDVKVKLKAKFEDLSGRAEELRVKVKNKKSQIELKLRAEGFEQKLKVKTEGAVPEETLALVDKLAATLTEPGETEIEIEKEPGKNVTVSVDGNTTEEQQALIGQIADSLEGAPGKAKISLEWEFELERKEVEENETAEKEEIEKAERELKEENKTAERNETLEGRRLKEVEAEAEKIKKAEGEENESE